MAGVRRPLLHPGPRTLRTAAWIAERLAGTIDLPQVLSPEALRVLAGVTYLGSPAKAERELGFTTRPFVEGMEQTLEHELRELQRARVRR
ncbi:MAG: hypothetical protein R2712_24060 [Vicinamibacterales bacterium]